MKRSSELAVFLVGRRVSLAQLALLMLLRSRVHRSEPVLAGALSESALLLANASLEVECKGAA